MELCSLSPNLAGAWQMELFNNGLGLACHYCYEVATYSFLFRESARFEPGTAAVSSPQAYTLQTELSCLDKM